MWFKVDDKLHAHEKALLAGIPAMGLWVMCGSWCASRENGGFVPEHVAAAFDREYVEHAASLVEARLWRTAKQKGSNGWRFHDWKDMQPTREQIEERRQKRVVAGQKGGKASGAARSAAKQERSKDEALASPLLHTRRSKSEANTNPDPYPTRPAAANAAAAVPPPLHSLWTSLEDARLHVRWDKLTAAHVEQIAALIDLHGIPALVRAARKSYRPDSPPVYAQAWIGDWQALPPLAAVKAREKCPTHRLELPCRSCAADTKAASA